MGRGLCTICRVNEYANNRRQMKAIWGLAFTDLAGVILITCDMTCYLQLTAIDLYTIIRHVDNGWTDTCLHPPFTEADKALGGDLLENQRPKEPPRLNKQLFLFLLA